MADQSIHLKKPNLLSEVAALFIATLTPEQAASLKTLLSFAGTTNMLRRSLNIRPIPSEYVAHVMNLMREHGWTSDQIQQSLAKERVA